MTVLRASASLSLYGRTPLDTAARVSATLGVDATAAVEVGDAHPDPELARRGRVATSSFWVLDEGVVDGGDGAARALSRLLDRFADREREFGVLAEHYDIHVWLAVATDAGATELSVDPGALATLGRLGATLHAELRAAPTA